MFVFTSCAKKTVDTVENATDSVLTLRDPAAVENEAVQKVNAFGMELPVDTKELNLSNKSIFNISQISKFTNLEVLDLSGNPGVTDWSYLNSLEKLKVLKISSNKLTDISFIKNFPNLREVDVSSNPISSFEVFFDNKNIEKINVSLTGLKNLYYFSSCTSLTEFNCSKNEIEDISDLEYLTKLQSLDVSDNKISDISVLSGLTYLRTLNISNNNIYDISSLFNNIRLTSLKANSGLSTIFRDLRKFVFRIITFQTLLI